MIPLFDVQQQNLRLRREIDERLAAVLDHGLFILGPEVGELLHGRISILFHQAWTMSTGETNTGILIRETRLAWADLSRQETK